MENRSHDENLDMKVEASPLSPTALGNEAGFWRKILRGEKRLTVIQKIGILLIYLTLGGVIWSTLYWENYVSPLKGTPLVVWIWDRLGGWIILFGIFMVLLCLLFWRARCALRKAQAERLLQPKKGFLDTRHS